MAVLSDLVNVFHNFEEHLVVKSSRQEAVVVGHVDQPLRDGDGRAKFLFHKVRHFCKMNFINFNECCELIRNVVQLFVHGLKMFFVKVGDVDQVVYSFIVVDNLSLQC